MNLLFVYPHAIIPHRGGTERVAYTIATALRQKGHQVWFMATKSNDFDAHLKNQPDYLLIHESTSDDERKQAVIEVIERYQIDIIINEGGEFENFSIFSNEVLPKVKIITCLHFDVYGEIKYFRRNQQYKNQTTSRIKRFIIDLCTFIGVDPYRIKFYMSKRSQFTKMLTVSDAVVVVTPIIAEQLKKITGINSNKIVSILNPAPFTSKKAKYDSSVKEKLLLYVGRFSPDKNVDKILQSWARLAPQYPDWKLEIAGDGEMRNDLLSMAQRLQIPRVHFHGHVEDVKPLYNRAEYVLLASDCEALPCVLQEALTFGCYPIIFDYPSSPIVISNNRIGTIIKRHTVNALANNIHNALKNRISNRHNLPFLHEHMQQFSIDMILPAWLKLLQHFCPVPHSQKS